MLTLEQTFTVKEVKKKTRAKLYETLKVGDQVKITLPFRSSYGATYVTSTNIQTGESHSGHSINVLTGILRCFEFEESAAVETPIREEIRAASRVVRDGNPKHLAGNKLGEAALLLAQEFLNLGKI